MPNRVPWSRDERLLAFRLYCRTPFGRLHQHNPEIIELARRLGRTPSAVGMKACNFASLDPVQQARNISALGNVSRADRELWDEFEQNAESVAAEAEAAWERRTGSEPPPPEPDWQLPTGPTDEERVVRTRRVQSFFRAAVLASYEHRCALTGIAVPELLNASHIIPWHADPHRRADPRNGICLNALHDRAFDRGLLTFDDDLRAVLSSRLPREDPPVLYARCVLEIEGFRLKPPHRFAPDLVALSYHRERIFRG